jgi:signal transduction histidine kinase/CheY-like chemotaxis protein
VDVTKKALAAVSTLMVALSGVYLVQGIQQHNASTEAAIRAEEAAIDATVADVERHVYEVYRRRLRYLVRSDAELREALAARDRDRLLARASTLLADLREENPSVHAWSFVLPDGTVFLRTQDPSSFGDNILASRPAIGEVNRTRGPAAGLDIGRHGPMYWVTEPVVHDGVYVGATELGLDTAQLMGVLNDRFHAHVAIVVPAGRWEKAFLVKDGYRVIGDQVLLAQRGSPFQQIPDEQIAASSGQQVRVHDRDFVLHHATVLNDFRGEPMASIVLLQDVTDRLEARRSFVIWGTVFTAALVIVCFFALYGSFRILIGRLEASLGANRRTNEELARARDELEQRVVERTEDLTNANLALDRQRHFLQTVIEAIATPFCVIDARTRQVVLANTAANPAGGELSLCHQLFHDNKDACSADAASCPVATVRTTKKPTTVEHVHQTGGVARTIQVHAYPVLDAAGEVVQVIEYSLDVTAAKAADKVRRNLERQLRNARQMEAIGKLAGGIAHDFNNILATIFGNAELVRYALPPDSDGHDSVEEILQAGRRAKTLVEQILAFGRPGDAERKPLLLHLVVKDVLKMLSTTVPAHVTIRDHIQSCDPVLSDTIQIHQVVMNLCHNAFHAMRDQNDGVMTVSLTPVTLPRDVPTDDVSHLAPGAYVKLEVSDTGCGIDEATIERIFDPYFTTRGKGEGTGLGLAIVRGIVQSSGGDVFVQSELGAGSTFRVLLPQCPPGTVAGDSSYPSELPGPVELPRGSESILLVDDEAPVLTATETLLRRLGYDVIAFTDSPKAWKHFSEDPERFDLVIMDMIMPNLPGDQLAQRMLERRPDLRILLITGFSETIDAEQALAMGMREFLMKPVLEADLARAVRRVLDTP